jgi:hypothetical protein
MVMKKLALLLLTGLIAISSVCIMGCNKNEDINESDIYFPAAKEAQLGYPMGAIRGTLIFDGKYLRLRVEFIVENVMITPGTEYLVIWPYGYSVNVEDGEIQILDESGQVVARVGDYIRLGGGETDKIVVEENYIGESLPDDIEESLPDDYEHPYWLASGIIIE